VSSSRVTALSGSLRPSCTGRQYAQLSEPLSVLLMGTKCEHPSRPAASPPIPPGPATSRLTSTDAQRRPPASTDNSPAGFLVVLYPHRRL